MRFLHLSDLHLGRRLNHLDLLEDQRYILAQIIDIAVAEGVDAVLIAGDVYDKDVPSRGAVTLLDEFLTELSAKDIRVFITSGNHDSAQRLGFGGELFKKSGIHLASNFTGRLGSYTLTKGEEQVHIWGLPFVRPGVVRAAYPDEIIENYTDAVTVVLKNSPIGAGTNILLAHQFVTSGGATLTTCESETISLGTVDNVDVSVFDGFDYVALGHIHTAQAVGRETVRYCGTPLAYSASETLRPKSVTLVETVPKAVTHRQIELSPLRAVRKIEGTLDNLLTHGEKSDDYIYATLTDKILPADAQARLRTLYKNLSKTSFSMLNNALSPQNNFAVDELELKTPAQLFATFFAQVHGRELSEEEQALLAQATGEDAL